MSPNTSASLALKGLAVGSTLWIASAMASTSLIFIPGLLRPLLPEPGSADRPVDANAEDRLTPQLETPPAVDLPPAASSRAVAQQFAQMDALAFRAQVPLELVTVAAYSALAYRSSRGGRAQPYFAVCAGLVAAVFPYSIALMVPYAHKLARLAGDEEKVEPFEDAPLDREAETSNTVAFLQRWNRLNAWRTLAMLAAGALGVRGLILER